MRRVIFSGTRDDDIARSNRALIQQKLRLVKEYDIDTIVVHGDAPGVDRLVDAEAAALGLEREKYPANWRRRGKSAGAVRNKKMADLPDVTLVVGFPGPDSRGTYDMLDRALRRGIETRKYPIA